MRLSYFYATFFACSVLANAVCASEKEANHAFAMHGQPKYDKNFGHFEYVNPNAP